MLSRRSLLLSLAAKPPIGIGFLGASHSHAEGKMEAVLANPAFHVVASTEPTRNFKNVLSRQALLQHPGIQVIAVESAVRDHARDGLAVLEAGKHLHLEKAPAGNKRDFEKIVSLARRNNRLLQIGYMWRYHPGINLATDAARQGWLGQVYLVRASIGNLLAADRRPEWAEFKGGNMFELGCHVLDPVVRLLGAPRRVTPFLHKHGKGSDTLADNTAAVLEYDSAMAIIHGSNLQPHSGKYRAFEVHGSNGAIIVNPIEPPAVTVDLDKPAGPYKAGSQQVPMPPYKRYVDDFIELAAAIRGEAQLRVSYDENLLVHDVLLRASGM
ncbi:MAG: Gfo/Idh/MocA family oxidoreductase [Acidobacteria bacterium]|nr:Gfo/Idh/MocA family oxidoreductase [Acidobacteriota bacterium]